MNQSIPIKYLELMEIEINHFVNCNESETCDRCNKLIQDLNGLKLK